MRTLVDRFRKSVRHRRYIQRLGIILALLLIVLAFLAKVQQRRGPKVRPHTLPRVPEAYRMPPYRIYLRSGGPFHCKTFG